MGEVKIIRIPKNFAKNFNSGDFVKVVKLGGSDEKNA